jgi:DNA-binding transcriptional MerR regulator
MSDLQQLDLFGNPIPSVDKMQKPVKKQAKAFVMPEPDTTIETPIATKEAIVVFEEPSVMEQEVVAEKVEKKIEKANADKPKSTRGRKSLKSLAAGVELVNIPSDEELQKKQYHNIGDVAGWFNVKISLIRFWSDKFEPILKPRKNGKGDRLFRPDDVKLLQMIHHLLREKKYTIEGALDYLKKNKGTQNMHEAVESLKNLRGFLLELKANL